MPDDPGVRFAVVTLCRYAILGLTSLIALGAIHLDLAKIGVVLAALGVGLGFGLQEVVSNFVCGIILLLERPIRIGDVVTVAGTTGKVDRINIRATTIVNSDNQSMIVPNREFITGNLVNWTLKDKILRVPIKMTVAYGTDPDRVVDLLLRIARADADVMINPAPSAALEGFGDSSLLFGLYTFVPEPGLSGDVQASPLRRDPAAIYRRGHRHPVSDARAPCQQPPSRPVAPCLAGGAGSAAGPIPLSVRSGLENSAGSTRSRHRRAVKRTERRRTDHAARRKPLSLTNLRHRRHRPNPSITKSSLGLT